MKKYNIKNGINIFFILLVIFSLVGPIVSSNNTINISNIDNYVFGPRGNTLYVGGSGPDNYSSIQAAVNDAIPNDTVYVYSGTYLEYILINKTISLIGESKETTIIEGSLTENCVKITADSTVINGFTIKKGLIGISIYKSSGQEIKNNIIRNNWEGIGLNQVTDAYFIQNSVSDNYFEGINPVQSSGNTFSGNKINWNIYGILFTNSDNNYLYNNEIKGNSRGIEALENSDNNNIYHNNFFSNDEDNAFDDYSNIWDDGYPSGGNYWDDYTGEDSDGDGIGDTPYNIPGEGNNKDQYPLMEPYIPLYPPDPPYNPHPSNSAIDVDINATLSWLCNDPDGDNLTFDVYFEAEDTSPDELVSNNQTENIYDPPGSMEFNTSYSWQIVAWDTDGHSTSGPIWHFTTSTEYNYPPDTPIIEGQTTGTPGEEYTFCISNTADPEGDMVYVYWDWGDGDKSGWLGPYESGEEICNNHSWNNTGIYSINARLKDEYGQTSEWGSLKVTMPRNKPINQIIQKFLERYQQFRILLSLIL